MLALPEEYSISNEIKYTKLGKRYWIYFIEYENIKVGYIKVKYKKEGLTLLSLNINKKHRNRGLARSLILNIIKNYGDQDLLLRPNPYKDKPVNKDKLKKFYNSLGFEEYGNEGRMVRKANPSRNTNTQH